MPAERPVPDSSTGFKHGTGILFDFMATQIPDVRSAAIRRLIRCRKTQRYFDGDGWTFNPKNARSFDHVIDAARECVDKQLESVDLVLQLPEAHAELFSTFLR